MREIRIDGAKLPAAMEIIGTAGALMAELDWWLGYLRANTGLDNVSDYIFYPQLVGLGPKATMEEIADRIAADRR